MNVKIKCPKCGSECWVKGAMDSDGDGAMAESYAIVDDSDPMDDACQHIKDGGDYMIIDSEVADDEVIES